LSGPIYFNFGHAAPFVASALLTAIGAVFLSRAHARPADAAGNAPAAPSPPQGEPP
jgi:hypothetical protein